MANVLVGFGGNVGNARKTIQQAVELFCDGTSVRLVKRSSDYRTAPWGVKKQPAFVNLCLAVSTEMKPRPLLERALSVERALGRDRAHEERWGMRTVDIDLLVYDDLTIQEPGLTLPHPRLLERAFVLVPLAEIAPELEIAGERVREAVRRLDRIDLAGIERLT